MIGLLIVTHGNIGTELLNVALATIGPSTLPIQTVNIGQDVSLQATLHHIQTLTITLDQGEGVLILTDIFGSTPSNIVHSLIHDYPVHIVTGLNLPMLIRVLNYSHLPLKALAQKAMTGGREGVLSHQSASELPL